MPSTLFLAFSVLSRHIALYQADTTTLIQFIRPIMLITSCPCGQGSDQSFDRRDAVNTIRKAFDGVRNDDTHGSHTMSDDSEPTVHRKARTTP